jgi:16S rRNA (guanine966-N2)-methyltransferase
MRVIAGKHRGRIIETVSSKKLRPTTGMAREAIFNILAHGKYSEDGESLITDANVLDLFCGCGALSMESLSRGASSVTLIDIDKEHLEIARKNIRLIDEEDKASFIRGDSATPPPARIPCEIIFLDPPYNEGLVNKALNGLMAGSWLAKNAIIIVESDFREDLKFPEQFEQLDNRKYGNSRIRILKWLG